MKAGETFRILSLDGGGLRGTFSAKFLAEIERECGIRVGDYFDMIAGTSTGSIIALGLSMGMRAEEMLEFYVERGPEIFGGRRRRRLHSLWRRKYSGEPLQKALEEVFGERTLGECGNRLVVPSFNLRTRRVKVFKTGHVESAQGDADWRAVDVAMASSAAPTYLPAFEDGEGNRFIDGGVWANNPALVAVIEAMGVLGIERERIRLLSIGTTHRAVSSRPEVQHGGKLEWATQIAELFLDADVAAADRECSLLLGEEDGGLRYWRVNPEVGPRTYRLDRLSEEFLELGEREAGRVMGELRGVFFGKAARAFEG
ncbi:MAG: CBASS cGAMP-activated phospholipase [Verrucomicrobiota bacterium]